VGFRLAVFTDTYDDVNGVATIYRSFVAAADAGASGRTGAPDISLAVFCLAEQTSIARGPGATVYRYRPRPRIALPRYPELQTGYPPRRRIAADFAAGGFDAVVVATPGPLGFLGASLARRHGLPLVGFYHTRFPVYLAVYAARLALARRVPRLAERIGYRWMRRLYARCDLVVCQSAAIAEEVRRSTDAPIAIWDTGVELASFRPGPAPAFRERHAIPADATVVTYVGRLASEKGLGILAPLSARLPELRFLVVGDGPLAGELAGAVRATFTGFLRGEALAEAYRAGDIFLFPSETDTFGNVLLEAMASGLPLVVVSGGPGAELVAKSGAGWTYPAGDVDAAAAVLSRLATAPHERRAMADRARAYAAERDWSVAFERFIDACRSAAAARSPLALSRHTR
jgi:glycosyltransferase involved in cell wall biosynthesis